MAEHTVETLLGLAAGRRLLRAGVDNCIVDARVAVPRKVPREIRRKHLTRIELLGEGTAGEVFLYKLQEPDKGVLGSFRIAAKSIKVGTEGHAEARRVLLHEAALGALLDHRNVMATVGVCTTP